MFCTGAAPTVPGMPDIASMPREPLRHGVRDERVPVVARLHPQPDEPLSRRRQALDPAACGRAPRCRRTARRRRRCSSRRRERATRLAVCPHLAQRIDELLRRGCASSMRSGAPPVRSVVSWDSGTGVDARHRQASPDAHLRLAEHGRLGVRDGEVDAGGARRRQRRPWRRSVSVGAGLGVDDDRAREPHAVLEDAAGVAEPRHDRLRRRAPWSACRGRARRAARRRRRRRRGSGWG